MRIGISGLGRMGANMTLRLLRDGHEIVAHNRSRDKTDAAAAEGAIPAYSLADLCAALEPPRSVWTMLPAGDPTAQAHDRLAELLEPGDIVVDGANSRYTDSVARAEAFAAHGIEFVDAGTSGGIWGLREGYCLMIGASEAAFARLEPVFAALAPDGGYARVGPPGAGHFVKMVHNGVEYALLQGYGEGFELLGASEFGLDLPAIAQLWRHGSVVRSWLLDLLASALAADPRLEEVRGYVEDSGEGRWTVEEAVRLGVPATAVAHSLFARFTSRQDDPMAMRVIAALRREFGGHSVRPTGEPD